MVHRDRTRQLKLRCKPVSGCDVHLNAPQQAAPYKSEKPKTKRFNSIGRSAAPKARRMVTGHKVTRTGNVLGFLKQLPRGTNVLEAVMFDNDRFSCNEPINDRSHCCTSHMDDVRFSNEASQVRGGWLPNDPERKEFVLVVTCRNLGNQRYGESC